MNNFVNSQTDVLYIKNNMSVYKYILFSGVWKCHYYIVICDKLYCTEDRRATYIINDPENWKNYTSTIVISVIHVKLIWTWHIVEFCTKWLLSYDYYYYGHSYLITLVHLNLNVDEWRLMIIFCFHKYLTNFTFSNTFRHLNFKALYDWIKYCTYLIS